MMYVDLMGDFQNYQNIDLERNDWEKNHPKWFRQEILVQ